MTLLFAQISGKDSLREIENALLANHKRLYHLGMEAVAKSTLSEAMNRRNPEIFKALFEEILDRVMAVAPKHKFKFKNPLYAIDSTTIDLCLSRYNWAYYRKHKGAIKLHTELDLSGNLPCFLLMSNGGTIIVFCVLSANIGRHKIDVINFISAALFPAGNSG